MRKTYIAIALLSAIMIFSVAALCTQFGGSPERPETPEPGTDGERQDEENLSPEEPPEEAVNDKDYQVVYLEIGTSEESTHFEHRVANIFTAAPDGSGNKLIYTDIESKYELGWIYGISPDGKKISCGFVEGGRGAYNSLSIIDIGSGNAEALVEFDYTESENFKLLALIYEKPIWSNDSSSIAYEVISNPYTDDFSDEGIFIIDILEREAVKIMVDAKATARDNGFLYPVLFSEDNEKIFNIFYTYGQEENEDPILNFMPKYEKLETVDISSGEIDTVIDINDLEDGDVLLGSFSAALSQEKLVFNIRDIFGENGEIWVSGLDGSNAARLTDTPDINELEASVVDVAGSVPMIAYTGIDNGPDAGEQFFGGDIYIIGLDGSGNKKITDYGNNASSPMISPDGRYIAFLHHNLDENMEYVQRTTVEVFDTQTGEITIAASGMGIVSLAGWVADE